MCSRASCVRPRRSPSGSPPLPGVNQVETRVVAGVNLEIEGFDDPVTGRIVSLPEHGEARLNVPWLRLGAAARCRMPTTRSRVSDDFAAAHGLRPGRPARRRHQGSPQTARRSPVSRCRPSSCTRSRPAAIFPDHQRYGVLWMNRRRSARPSTWTARSTTPASPCSAAPHGTRRDRRDRRRARPLRRRRRLRARGPVQPPLHHRGTAPARHLATVFPAIFLGVAAFLLNVVITRLIALEREQIGTLKAFGYGDVRDRLRTT